MLLSFFRQAIVIIGIVIESCFMYPSLTCIAWVLFFSVFVRYVSQFGGGYMSSDVSIIMS